MGSFNKKDYKDIDLLEDIAKDLRDFRTEYLQALEKHNHFVKVRANIIDTPSEYYNHCGDSETKKENVQHLLVKGCEATIQEQEKLALKIIDEFYQRER